MAAKEISVKKYVVRLSREERERLETLIRKGKSPAQRLLRARILLKADVSEAGEGWSDSRIIKTLETSVSMVYRVRKQLVEEGRKRIWLPQSRDRRDRYCISCGIEAMVYLPLQHAEGAGRGAVEALGRPGDPVLFVRAHRGGDRASGDRGLKPLAGYP